MKKLWIGLVLAVMLTACGGGSDGNSGNNTGSTASDTNNNGSSPNPPATPGGDSGGTGNPGTVSPSFGQPTEGQIRPGVIVQAMGSQCTSNFLYTDTAGNFYLGAAAHCFSPDASSDIDPCEARNEAIGIDVEIENAAFMGSLAFTSWQAMQDNNETPGSGICAGNDFALIKLDARDHSNMHPAARVFQGPTALFEGDASPGDEVFTYGQSPFSLSQAKTGSIDSQSEDGWIYFVSLSSPGVPGDSGSAVLHETGKALGVLSTLNACIGLCPLTSNGVVNLDMALAYANANGFNSGLQLVTWSTFTP